ncbi:MAG TPA: hypothetical protein VFL87_01880 [Thermoleophilaceae bacterium]|nr:hypothetical protein [Thermoleophilaceae bacterium]
MKLMVKILLAVLGMFGFVFPAASGGAPKAHASTAWYARMTVATHTPRANHKVPVKIVVRTRSGRRLSGTVQYHFIVGGGVVGTRSCHNTGSVPCHFRRGIYRDTIKFPPMAEGYRITFQAVVKTNLGTKKLNYWIQVRR